MATEFLQLQQEHKDWIKEQKMFFVASAPLNADGKVNLSPKGMDSLRILDDKTVAYLDLTGSGIETISHLRENGRITIMWCSFEKKPQIFRIHGKGEVHEKGSPAYKELIDKFEEYPGARAIIKINAERISDSCGYAVPLYEFKGERDTLTKAYARRDETTVEAARKDRNKESLDGLPGWEGKYLP